MTGHHFFKNHLIFFFFSNPDLASHDQEDGLERKVAKKT